MTLVVIKLGSKVYNGKKEDEGYDLLRFLNAIMYPHRGSFMGTISDYIDFSENEELWKEAERMDGLGECFYNEIREELLEEVKAEVREAVKDEVWEEVKGEVREEVKGEVREDTIQAVVQDYIDDQLPANRILAKLQKVFGLTEEMSQQYYQKYLSKV